MSFTIVTDSCCNLPAELVHSFQLKIIPLIFHVKDQDYVGYTEGVPLELKQFYDMMRSHETVTTSGVTPQSCYETFQTELEQGNDVLYIGFSSGLSSTYSTASMALEQLRENYPNRKAIAVDSLCAALGQGLLVTYAVQLRDKGKQIDEVAQWVEDNRLHVCHWFTVDDLFFLHRGGRVSKAAAIVGSMVGIKPVLHVDDSGHLIMKQKVRGRRTALNHLLKKMEELAIEPEKQLVYIVHGDCEADAQYLGDRIKERFGVQKVLIHCLDPVIGSHSGPGTVALFFMGKKR